jgi:hypothetical protein
MAIGSGGGELEKVMLIIFRAGDDQFEVPNIPEVVTDSVVFCPCENQTVDGFVMCFECTLAHKESPVLNSKREIMNLQCCRSVSQIGMKVEL